MPVKKPPKQKPAMTTVQCDKNTRKDLKTLAKIEARKEHLPSLYDNHYLARLIAREKATAIDNGDWPA